MADYKTIHGINVRDYTTDPDTLITGQVWYDTTNKVLQFQATGAGAWSTTNNLNTARDQIAGAGTTTSGLVFGENFEHFMPALKLKKCSYDFAKSYLNNYINQTIYNKMISRDVNFRPRDITSIRNFFKPILYKKRLIIYNIMFTK